MPCRAIMLPCRHFTTHHVMPCRAVPCHARVPCIPCTGLAPLVKCHTSTAKHY
jgi:hypothetical protein